MLKEMLLSALVAIAPSDKWVTLKNPDPIESVNRTLMFGESCAIKEGGKLTVIADSIDASYLVRYDAPDIAGGTLCPTGAIFEISKETFATMTAEYEAKVASEQAEIARIRALLKPATTP